MDDLAGVWLERYIDETASKDWMRYRWTRHSPPAIGGEWSTLVCTPWAFLCVQGWVSGEVGFRSSSRAADGTYPAIASVRDSLDYMCNEQPSTALACTGGQLLSWCEFVEDEPCSNCDGSGMIPPHIPQADRICIECEGVGYFRPGTLCVRPGLVLGTCFDRNRLGWLLPPELIEEDTPLTLGLLPVPEGKYTADRILTIDGDGFRLALASLNPEGNAVATAREIPHFRPDDHYLNLFLEREDPVTRSVLEDYCQDHPAHAHEVPA